MNRSASAALLAATLFVGILCPASVRAQDTSDLAGRWTLNRGLSQFPRELGFGMDMMPADASGRSSTASGGKGRRGSGGGGGGAAGPTLTTRRESVEDVSRVQQLTAEVRSPSAYLTIVEIPTAVTVTNDAGQSRTFHPNGKEEVLQLDGVPVGVTAKREAGRLVVLYRVESGRDLRYTYSHNASPPQLVIDVQFIERGGGDEVRRVYEPASAAEIEAAAAASAARSAVIAQGLPPTTTKPGAGLPSASALDPGKTVGPSSSSPAAADRLPQGYNQKPDAELKGLTKLGLVVEDLSPQAAACGLSQGAIETAVSKRLSDAGFKVLRNSDEDTYVYVNVITTSVSAGLCVSRYDAFLYTHTTARLSYQEIPVLVQVSLLHRGGIAGGAAAAHGEGVLRGVQEYVDQFAARIRAANK